MRIRYNKKPLVRSTEGRARDSGRGRQITRSGITTTSRCTPPQWQTAASTVKSSRNLQSPNFGLLWPLFGDWGGSAGDGALAGGADELGVLAEHTGRVARRRRGPVGPSLPEYGVVDEQVESTCRDVEPDPVAVADVCDRPSVCRLRRDV